jgi:hypothetical protein
VILYCQHHPTAKTTNLIFPAEDVGEFATCMNEAVLVKKTVLVTYEVRKRVETPLTLKLEVTIFPGGMPRVNVRGTPPSANENLKVQFSPNRLRTFGADITTQKSNGSLFLQRSKRVTPFLPILPQRQSVSSANRTSKVVSVVHSSLKLDNVSFSWFIIVC